MEDAAERYTRGRISMRSSLLTYFRNFCAIFAEIGERYGSKVAGYWFDFCPSTSPIALNHCTQRPRRAIQTASSLGIAGSIANQVTFRSTGPAKSGNFSPFPIPNITAISSPTSGFFFDDEWTHEEPDTDMPPPLYRTVDLIDHIKAAGERRIPVSMNVGVYQDGTVSKATMQQLLEIKQAIRHT